MPPGSLRSFVRAVHDGLAMSQLSPRDRQRASAVLDLLTRESLSLEAHDPPFSCINNDGIPFQFCVSLGTRIGGLRYLTEIGAPSTTLRDRVALTRRRLPGAFRLIGFPCAFDKVLDVLCGLTPDSHVSGACGGVWVAVAFGGGAARMRVYANIGWGPSLSRWERIGSALSGLAARGFGRSLRPLLGVLVPQFTPVGLAVTLPTEPLLLKLYLRPTGGGWESIASVLDRIATPGLDPLRKLPSLLDFTPSDIRERGLLLSFAGLATGGSLDVKVDVCGHCLFQEADPVRAIESLCSATDTDCIPYAHTLDAFREAGEPHIAPLHAFIGVGVHPTNGTRVNVYLKPPAVCTASHDVCRTREAVRAAVNALVERQRGGLWIDYLLPVGASTSWTTAYVADALLDAAPLLGDPTIYDRLALAATALSSRKRPQGWGYNEAVECDADSTALALLVLARLGAPADPSLLARFRNSDGGYGTFRRDDPADSWAHTHFDVTPNVLRALWSMREPVPDDDLAALSDAQTPSGNWRSYWWGTDLFATEAAARVLRLYAIHPERDVRSWITATPVEGAFETALALRAMKWSGDESERIATLTTALLRMQQSNGMWSGSGWLRVTDSTARATEPHGRLYVDGGTVTTATAVAALAVAA